MSMTKLKNLCVNFNWFKYFLVFIFESCNLLFYYSLPDTFYILLKLESFPHVLAGISLKFAKWMPEKNFRAWLDAKKSNFSKSVR